MKIGENGQVTSVMYLAIEVYFVFEGKELVIFNKLLKEKKKSSFSITETTLVVNPLNFILVLDYLFLP